MQRTEVSPTQLAEELVLFMTSSMKAAQNDIFELVDELGVTISQFKIMHLVESAGGEATTSKLAKLTGLSPAATSRAADALARQGILERREDEADRRVKWLALTAKGREAIDRIMTARIQGLARLAEALDPDQRGALFEALAPLIASTPDPENSA